MSIVNAVSVSTATPLPNTACRGLILTKANVVCRVLVTIAFLLSSTALIKSQQASPIANMPIVPSIPLSVVLNPET